MELEDKIPPRKIKGVAKGLEIDGFGIVDYYVRSESGCMVAFQAQEYYVLGLPKYLTIISPQLICTSEGYKCSVIYPCHDKHYIYADLNKK